MKQILSTIILLNSILFAQDPIVVSPAILDFGNVLMGNSPTMSFTITANLDQEITITPSSYYESDITLIAMTDGQTQEVNITFTPPSIGNYDSFIALVGSTFGSASVVVNTTVINTIEGALSGLIRAEYSPYEVSGDIWVEEGDSLILEPGVTLLFQGSFSLSINGHLSCLGTPESKVELINSPETPNGWRGLYAKDGSLELYYTLIDGVDINGYNKMTSIGIQFDDLDEPIVYSFTSGNLSLSVNSYYSYPNSLRLYDDYYNASASINLGDTLLVSQENAIIKYMVKASNTTSGHPYTHVNIYNHDNNTSINSPQYTATTGWTEYSYDLSEYLNSRISLSISLSVFENYSFYIDNIEVSGIGSYGISLEGSEANINNSAIRNCGNGINLYDSEAVLLNSVIYDNIYLAVNLEDSFFSITNSIIFANNGQEHFDTDHQIVAQSGVLGISYSSVQNIHSTGIYGAWSEGGGNTEAVPYFLDDQFHLDPLFSPLIDIGNPNISDNCIPPGLGTTLSDIGMYGGTYNCGVNVSSNTPEGLPQIHNIYDLPQDQGGYVGIQYQGSIYDYENDALDITHYSFWRDMNLTAKSLPDFNVLPVGSVYRVQNEYWENVGEMDAQGFVNYGFSAPTLADSIGSEGIFWSKYLVVAHTLNDDIFFVSEVDSGYSIDNTAPIPPSLLSTNLDGSGVEATWSNGNPDIAFWDIYRDGEMLFQVGGLSFRDTFEFGEIAEYTIRGVDIHENIGAFSIPFGVSNGILGDVTWNQQVDVLDASSLIHMIINPEEEYAPSEIWAADMNDDTNIDIADLPLIIDIIMGGALASMVYEEGSASLYLIGSTLYLDTVEPIAGIQIRFDASIIAENLSNLSFQTNNNITVLYTLSDEMLIGNHIPILELSEAVGIDDLIIANHLGQRIEPTLDINSKNLVPLKYAVHQNYPNPFNPNTTIQVDLNQDTHLIMTIYDVRGMEVRTLVDEDMLAGYHLFDWDGTNSFGNGVSSGIYFFRLKTQTENSGIKATLLR
jgi:hypothetical protein